MTELREHRVFGPPGTGKTRYLADQAPKATAKFGDYAVVICSLTRAAAAEIGSRADLPREQVGTLHSLCFRGLELNRGSIAEGTEGLKAWNKWIGSRVPVWQIDTKHTLDPENAPAEAFSAWTTDGERLLAEVGVLRARRTNPKFWPPEPTRFHRLWCEWKTDSRYVDFTDLLERGLTELPECPGDPTVLMADEAQDMSALEMALLRSWSEHVDQLVIVGDPDQNLYQWRGSDPEVFSATTAASERTLSRSWRVPHKVHAYAVEWIQQIPGRVPTEYLPRLDPAIAERASNGDLDPHDSTLPTAEGAVTQVPYRWAQPEALIPQLVEDAERGTVMVLATCSYMLAPLIGALRQRGVPFHNPYRVENGGWNPLVGAGRLLAFLRPDPATWDDEKRIWSWDDVNRWAEPLTAKDVFKRGAKTWIEGKARPDRFGEASPPIDLLALLKQLEDEDAMSAIANVGFSPEHTAAAVEWWWRNVRASRQKSIGYSVNVYRRSGGRALRREPRIVVGTIHSVKGGEANTVYVFPDLSRAGYWGGWDRPGTSRDAIRRQFYVAFTRARDTLKLCRESGAEYVQLPAPKED